MAGGDVNLYGYVLGNPVNFVDPEGLFVCGGVCVAVAGIAVGIAFDAAINAIRGSDGSGAATAANAAGGAAVASTVKTQSKPRGGIAGGGPAGTGTSVASKINHNAAKNGKISIEQRNLITKGLRKVPYVGVGLGLLELADAINDRLNRPDSSVTAGVCRR